LEVSLTEDSPFLQTKLLKIENLLQVVGCAANIPCQWLNASVYHLELLGSGHAKLIKEQNSIEWFPIASGVYYFLSAPYVYSDEQNEWRVNTHMDSRQRRAVMLK
jgi:hypothetical protein